MLFIQHSVPHFQILHYTGNGSTSSGITRTFDGSVNLKPGLMYHHKIAGGGNYQNIMENEYTGPDTLWLASSGDSVSANFDQIEETMDLSFIFDGMSIFSEAHN